MENAKSRGTVRALWGAMKWGKPNSLATGKGITVNDWSNMCSTCSNNADYIWPLVNFFPCFCVFLLLSFPTKQMFCSSFSSWIPFKAL